MSITSPSILFPKNGIFWLFRRILSFIVNHKPIIVNDEPFIGSHKPVIVNGKPFIGTDKPIIVNHKPIIGSHKPIIINDEGLLGDKLWPFGAHSASVFHLGYIA